MVSNNLTQRTERDEIVRVTSCNSEWVIDEAHKLYLRVPRGAKTFDPKALPRDLWSEFSHFVIDDHRSELIIYLNAECSRIIKAHLHSEDCGSCGDERRDVSTIEMSRLDNEALP
ncbi:hypothetical protein SAMN02745225_01904 [Ferrithrix thermotolerans DSM 19514]|jgi:hypothetical protein|uniref:Uncharacterized protein n=1 Tax=Ferrithrix thermotolerans DSM 19514 TaxID=1121881 RepID=A0A1M4X639_9ACTN|nr:hypothetical protein SAMN02745225_01904 [Ferrithrix thermotolerans DSM 19514]